MEGHINSDSRAIVMEYLLHYCYKNTAKAFLKEMQLVDSCIKAEDNKEIDVLLDEKNVEWTSIDVRRDIQIAIQEGDIAKAFTLIESHFPQLIKTYEHYNQLKTYQQSPPRSHYIMYKLRCQQFIETKRSSGDMEAIAFAQRYLRPCYGYYTDYMNNVAVLMAYKDLENDTTRDLFSQHRRDSIADEVNEMILESRQTALEKLKRQKTIVQIELDSQVRQELLKKQKEAEVVEKVSM